MTLEELTRHTSPYLLCWIDLAIAPRHLSVPYDLKKIKRLTGKDFPVPHSEYTQKKLAYLQNFLTSGKGDWALLGEMTGLQVLEFPRRTPPGIIEDFSFLPRLTHLKHLDLQYTGFKDCSLLTGLNELKQLSLPARKKLLHPEVLDTLSGCTICTDESFYQDDSFPSYKVLPVQEVPTLPPDGFAIRFLKYGSVTCTDQEITKDVVEKLVRLVRKGQIHSLCLALDVCGEENFFTMDIEDNWAAPIYNIWNEDGEAVCFQPVNDKYDSVEEDAPVEIGGQSPVPKRFALDDLSLAAECVLYFAKTGRLYPAVPWAEFS
ncbi:MAG: hypothetical protein HFI91_03385 [Lachnospiraceae bacterium]|jgi:hypothetical protein|nr:hypothetical protein [Lachnospiraceae bacterium]